MLGLSIASVATWALFNVMLPTLFGVLSIVFGRSFRRAAVRVDYAGRRGRAHLQRAAQQVTRHAEERRQEHHRPAPTQRGSSRVRVTEAGRQRVDAPTEEEVLETDGEELPSDEKRRRL
jgi:hypothetical protein